MVNKIQKPADDLYLISLDTFVSRNFRYPLYVPIYRGVMIDSGFIWARSQLMEALEEIDIEVELIVNTHPHEDHIGNNSIVSEQFGCPIVAPEETIPAIRNPDQVPFTVPRWVLWGRPDASDPEPLDQTVKHRDLRLEVLKTPGHSPDHHCLYDPDRGWLFSADLYISDRIRFAAPYENQQDMMNSIRRVLDLDINRLFCYHRGEISSPGTALERKLEHFRDLRDHIRSERKSGKSVEDIAKELLSPAPWYLQIFQTKFSRENVIRSFLKESGETPDSYPYDV